MIKKVIRVKRYCNEWSAPGILSILNEAFTSSTMQCSYISFHLKQRSLVELWLPFIATILHFLLICFFPSCTHENIQFFADQQPMSHEPQPEKQLQIPETVSRWYLQENHKSNSAISVSKSSERLLKNKSILKY